MINMEELAVITGGNKTIMETILNMYLETHSQDHALMLDHIANSDSGSLFSCSHTLKGTLQTMCENETVQMLEVIEKDSREGSLPDDQLMQQVVSSLKEINNQIETYLAT
ncbi:Hpt domain-containing protein [Aliagarivorans marinus]|uniref:Hpt domain-containing protein n=1 Tax=Aliagarivorans marinus TaxID=561965 RepID=UPI00047CFEB3|nr:Hpt domain-containing protein [Aliagarivorans marinus]